VIEYRCEGPSYRSFPYERVLGESELRTLTGGRIQAKDSLVLVQTRKPVGPEILRRLAFTSRVHTGGAAIETDVYRFEQSGLAARSASTSGRRKESNYLTHGLHRFKGKFYPQLSRALLNISGARPGRLMLDPFAGSGTSLVEAWLSGVDGVGFDISPLAHLIATTKIRTLEVGPDVIARGISEFEHNLARECRKVGLAWHDFGSAEPVADEQFPAEVLAAECGAPEAVHELESWFPSAVRPKVVAILRAIRRGTCSATREFLRVCLSDQVRDASQQEPRDLRVRRRAVSIEDAPLIASMGAKVLRELAKLQAGYAAVQHDGWRRPTVRAELQDVRDLRIEGHPVFRDRKADAVVSSPPYATALPYIDTDRLSFLILGLTSRRERNALQRELIGTREIGERQRMGLEAEMEDGGGLDSLPKGLSADLRYILDTNRRNDVGFRRKNTPALLYQYFRDMRQALRNVSQVLQRRGLAYFVLGDSQTTLGNGETFAIRTCDHIAAIAEQVGFTHEAMIPITVTTEDLAHAKNFIVENQIVVLRRE